MQICYHQPSTTAEAKPRHILKEIFRHKLQEVLLLSKQLSLADLQNQISSAPPPRDFLCALRQNPNKPSLIAEVKKAKRHRVKE